MAESTELNLYSKLGSSKFYESIGEFDRWYKSTLFLDYTTKYLSYKNVLDSLNSKNDLYSLCSKRLFWKEGKLELCIPEFEKSEEKSYSESALGKGDSDGWCWVDAGHSNEEKNVSLKVRRKRINRRRNGNSVYQPGSNLNFINEKSIERSFESTVHRLSNLEHVFGDDIFKGTKSTWRKKDPKRVTWSSKFKISEFWLSTNELVKAMAYSYEKIQRSVARFSKKEYKRLKDQLKLVLNETSFLNSESRLNIQLYLEQLTVKIQLCNKIKIPNLFQTLLAVFLPNRYYIYPIDEEAILDRIPKCFL